MLRILKILLALCITVGAYAQTPQYTSPNGTSNNIYPLRSNNPNMVQWIYTPADFTPTVPAGLISKLYIRVHATLGAANTAVYTNLLVRMGHTTATATYVGPWMTGFTTVYNAANVSFPYVLDSWLEITLQTPFFYNAVDNLMLEISHSNQTNGIYIVNNTASPNRRMWGLASGTSSTGAGAGLMYMGFDLQPDSCTGTPASGVAAFTSSNDITCGENVSVQLQNAEVGLGITYDWQTSINNGITWVSSGQTGMNATLSGITQNTSVRCVTSCTFSNSSANSNVINITVSPIEISAGNDSAICDNASMDLSVLSYNPTSVTWDDNSTNHTRTISSPGNYYVTMTHNNGCVSTDTVYITDGAEPVNPFDADYDLCGDATITLDAQNANMSYLWNTSATTQTITVSNGGMYDVDITSGDMCMANFSTNVIDRPKPVFNQIPSSVIICDGDSFFVDATAQNAVAYAWNNGVLTPDQYLKDEQVYTVIATTDYGCQDSAHVDLEFRPQPLIEGFTYIPGFYNQLREVQFAPINPTNVNTYLWIFGDGDSSTLQNPLHVYDSFGDYDVTLYVYNDCSATNYTQEIRIKVGTTGISGQEAAVFGIYPVPSKGDIHIRTDINIEDMQFVIYSMDGKVLKTGVINNKLIDAQELNNGNYILEIKGKENTIWREKLMILK